MSSFFKATLRALYLGDNDFEYLSAEIGNLRNLQIVSLFNPKNFLRRISYFKSLEYIMTSTKVPNLNEYLPLP